MKKGFDFVYSNSGKSQKHVFVLPDFREKNDCTERRGSIINISSAYSGPQLSKVFTISVLKSRGR